MLLSQIMSQKSPKNEARTMRVGVVILSQIMSQKSPKNEAKTMGVGVVCYCHK